MMIRTLRQVADAIFKVVSRFGCYNVNNRIRIKQFDVSATGLFTLLHERRRHELIRINVGT